MDLVLHLGAHRTGTTAIQHTLRRNRRQLMQRGVGYWGPGILRKVFSSGLLTEAAGDMTGLVAQARRRDITELLRDRALAARENNVATILLSDENLPGTMPGNLGEAALYPQAQRRLSVLASLLPIRPSAIFLAIRDYAEFWASIYAFSALRRRVPDFDAIGPDVVASRRGWVEVIGDIRAAFPGVPVKIWPYARHEGALAACLAEMLGPSRTALPDDLAIERRNQNPGAAALGRAIDLRRAGADKTGHALAELASVDGADRPYMPFSDAEHAALSQRYAHDRARLAGGEVDGVVLLDEPGAGR